jgi:hypothetical protein
MTKNEIVSIVVEKLTTEENHEVVVYTENLRSAHKIICGVYCQLNKLEDVGCVTKLNKTECLQFRTNAGSTNSFFAYPKKEQNMRGTGSRGNACTIIEERAFPMIVQPIPPPDKILVKMLEKVNI